MNREASVFPVPRCHAPLAERRASGAKSSVAEPKCAFPWAAQQEHPARPAERKRGVVGVTLWGAALFAAGLASAADAAGPVVSVGVAKVDITPELPIRLSGYQSRATEASRVELRLQARALAMGAAGQEPVVLIAAELIGVGEETSAAVAAALRERHRLDRSRLAVCATHTHTGPALADAIPFMFSKDLPAEEADRIARYTATLRGKLIEVALAALADRKPARLAWGEGKVDFATQRRTVVDGKWKGFGLVPEGPVDHVLPVLK
ncbi:MAG: hypothetical protein FJ399_19610, partial [Verrucomicrobia bacterium]|nr:hypothetical protein [Verrucomicrobiota bacterium]